MQKLKGKVAVITGGGTGLGLATAALFVQEGAYVYIMGRRQSELDHAVQAIGRNITAVQGDISRLADIQRMYKTIQQHHKQIHVVFANAGVTAFSPLTEVTEEQLDRLLNINVKGTFFTVQQALPLLADGSSILLTSSQSTSLAFPGLSIYNATKAAIRSVARTWSGELLDRNIRVNVISPGVIDTPILDEFGTTEEEVAQIKHLLASRIPMKRIGTPNEIARAALFLASDDSSFTTGQELFVDGGAIELGSTQLR
ncbi:putative oxidoreductase YkvO [Reticulibacter mediterranei]|uniref:Putative oxidoreductase YkvO n=1 Tax=Reticulibacter mediterranei TaxID=2778369 RepID=A0A8J3ISZ3_9CHLR|nr:SDR family oxidoreductase [Reticulibacter mediterranei]GHO97985.1 putative oxidoreductase YkvO [Reticulibacter mediterranei]